MSYTANTDLQSVIAERILIQLSADDPYAAAPDWLVVAEARAYADAQIDARLRQRYALPLSSVPRELKDWALALARYWLYSRRPDGQELPPAVVMASQDAIKALDAVRDGKMSLDLSAEPVATTTDGGRLTVIANDRLYTTDWLSTY